MTNKMKHWEPNYEDSKTFTVSVIIALILLLGLAGYFATGLIKDWIVYAQERKEVAECQEWQDTAVVTPGFYLLQWQKDQCDHRGIEVNARVN